MKRTLLVCGIVIVAIIGLVIYTKMTKTFTKQDFKITLTNEFKEDNYKGVNYYFISRNSGISVLKEKFDDLKEIELDSESSLDDYAKAVLSANNREARINENKGFYYFTYDDENGNERYYYMTTLFKGEDAFWLVNFFGKYEDRESLEMDFLRYARTINV